MSKEPTAVHSPAAVICDVLAPLSPEDKARTITAVLIMLGIDLPPPKATSAPVVNIGVNGVVGSSGGGGGGGPSIPTSRGLGATFPGAARLPRQPDDAWPGFGGPRITYSINPDGTRGSEILVDPSSSK